MPGEFVGFTRIPVVVVVAVVALEVRRGDVLEGTRFGFRELIEDSFCTPIRFGSDSVCVTADKCLQSTTARGNNKRKRRQTEFAIE